MNYYKAVFDFQRPVEVKVAQQYDILQKMSLNPLFAAPPVPYPELEAALTELGLAIVAAQYGGIERTATKKAKEKVVDDIIRRYKTYVDMVADGNTDIILASGFRHTKPRQSAGQMPQIEGTRGGSNGKSGEIQLKWNPIPNHSFYRVEVRPVDGKPTDNSSVETETTDDGWKPYSTKPASIVIGSLKPLTYYEVRVQAVGAAGPGPFSDPITVLVT